MNEKNSIPAEAVKQRLVGLEEELVDALRATIHSGQYLQGHQVAGLEKRIVDTWGPAAAVATSSGTASLQIALMAAGVQPGDEVIVPALTFVSTSYAVNAIGAFPVFVDIDPLTLTMDPAAVRRAINGRTAAIVPVHLYGQMADMEQLCAVAGAHGLKVVEDCAQAHGATYFGRYAGTLGDFGCFSLYAGKIVGSLEDAGMVLAKREEDRDTLLKLRDLGRLPGERYKHHAWGMRARMGEFTARVIQVELDHLDAWIAARREVARLYDEGLAGLGLHLPRPAIGRGHVYYKYTVVAASEAQRDMIERHLGDEGVQTERIYPQTIPDQPAYLSGELPCRAMPVPAARSIVRRLTCLPVYPELAPTEIARIVEAVKAGCAEWAAAGKAASTTAGKRAQPA